MNNAQVISVLDKTIFDFTFVGAGATQTIILERALPVIPFYYLWMGVRCHNRDFGGGTGTMVVEAFSTLPSEEDPAEFTSTAAPNLAVTISNSTVAPSRALATTTAMGPMIKLQLRAVQMTVTPRTLYSELSVVLYGRAS